MYKSTWPIFNDHMIKNVNAILKSGKVNQWTGSKVFEFEKKFSEYFGVKHAVAVFNGTVAIELCLKSIGLQVGDEVIVTARTFIASASSVNMCGGIPVFVDVDPNSQNPTLCHIKNAVTNKTKAIILVHLAGWPCDLDEIVDWCHSSNIYVIEDCAQAHGAKYNGKYVGSFGDINAWSFCQDKIISTGGEGGMVTTNNTQLYLKAWSFKDHGKNYDKMFKPDSANGANGPVGLFRWVHDSLGTNWRMTEMQASIGLDALEYLEEWVNTRRKNASIFNDTFKDISLVRLTIPNDKCYHAYYKYYCFIRQEFLIKGITRNDIISKLNRMTIPCYQGTCGEVYKEKAYDMDMNLPITKELSETSLMFLVDPSYSDKTIEEIARLVKNVFIEISK
jgi:dTDP-4-amino-4,6-dideoxygalactose transaminase